MQFEFSEDHAAIGGLARQIFSARASADALREVEDAGGFDAGLWQALAEADLLGVALPDSAGGAGMGMLGLVALLEEQGRRVAAVPLWSSIAGAALPLAEFGTDAQRRRWLPGFLEGSHVLTGAFEVGDGTGLAVRAEADGDGWALHGSLAAVPAADRAAAFVLPVRLPTGAPAVAVVPADAAGVTTTAVDVTSHESHAAVDLDGVAVTAADLLDGDGAHIVSWTLRRARVALAALAAGVCSEALAMTAAYTSERMQFGRALSTNQAVSVRAADTHLDAESIRLTACRAAWLMDAGREEEAEPAALVAKWWASRGGLRAVHATQHLHGGIGADVDYPIHRYFLRGRQIAFTLGSADAVAAELGAALA
ncbi:acyl-CoA dehydrogenase family protein [Tomitella fengzijianii]|uniref:Acyl-CoA dehydrogenase n=1 Tax=Tomitella fengzijianii TaxID=2597660 RepID=A0A516WZA1_9ACTN|nr:acyl-CoA dehydrogenase family protein [Tomitella fengzijianii]QDQ96125.1 acyl-CoA dehydrogenase [Tomitella fengzijianii]